jgi:hypothetical protein
VAACTVVAALVLGASAAAAGATAQAGAVPAAAAPAVREMVVFRDGGALAKTVSTRATRVRVGGRRCGVAGGTALAALVRLRPGPLRLRDFGSCSANPRDSADLFVRAIRSDANRGQDGWVYKVGRRAATAGAANPAGPFGHGRLRAGQRVTWFYCHLRMGGCQRTLELSARGESGAVVASVRGYDDDGHGVPVAGARVRVGGASTQTDAAGNARLPLAHGSHLVVAEKRGLVRSFAERVAVP